MYRLIYLIFFISWSYSQSYEMSVDHPLKACKSRTLLDEPKACLNQSQNKPQCEQAKRMQKSLRVRDQKNFSTCTFAGMSTELNYLFKRTYSQNDYELPWIYLTILGKGGKLNCSLGEGIKEIRDQGNNYEDSLNNIKKVEKYLLEQEGRGLCYSRPGSDIDKRPNEMLNTSEFIFRLFELKAGVEELDNFPLFKNYLKCESDILQKHKVFNVKDLDFDEYMDELKVCLSFKSLEEVNATTCNDLRLNLSNIAYQMGVREDYSKINIDDHLLLFFERYMSTFLQCRQVDEDVEKNRFIKEAHKPTTLYYDEATDELVDTKKEGSFLNDCLMKSGMNSKICKEKMISSAQTRQSFWGVVNKAIANENDFKNRPLSVSFKTRVFNNKVFKKNFKDTANHLMNIIGVSDCGEKKCILIQNSWGERTFFSSKEAIGDELKWSEVAQSNFLPFKVRKFDFGGERYEMDYSRFWVCGDDIKKHLNKVYYLKTSRDLLKTN